MTSPVMNLRRFAALQTGLRRWWPALALVGVVWLLLVGVLLRPHPWTLDMGAAYDHTFSTRFSVPESGDNVTFRWSLPESRLLLHGVGTHPLTLDVRLHYNQRMRAAHDDYRVSLSRQTDGHPLADFALAPTGGWRVYRVLLPAEALVDSWQRPHPLAIGGSSYRPGDGDNRSLGVPVDRVGLAPLGGRVPHLSAVLLRASMLTWTLAVLAGVCWRLHALFVPRPSLLTRLLLVDLPVLVATGALLAALLWNPYRLAWALPALPASLTLATLVLLLTLRNHPPPLPIPAADSLPDVAPRRALLLLAGVFGVALLLRFYQLDSLPYGLWRDEAEHGLVALRMLEDASYRPIYIAEGRVNMPALGFYPFLFAVQVWGIHLWTFRTVTALAGALTVLPLYALVLRLFKRRDLALLAAALLAVSSWHITLSRYSFPTIMEPLFALSGLWLLLAALDTSNDSGRGGLHRALHGLAAGIAPGVGAQAYHTGRIVPVVAGGLALLLLWQAPQHWRRWLLGGVAAALGFALVTSPLLWYAATQPAAVNDRVGRVFLLGNAYERGRAPLGDLDESLGNHLLMFNLRGDSNGRHHAPFYPLLDMFSGVGLLAGAVLLLRHWRDWRSLFLPGALAAGLLPSLLAVDGPHAMRSIGALAFAYCIAAVGWFWLALWLRSRLPPERSRARRVRGVVWGGVLAGALLWNSWVYFGAMPQNVAVWGSFYPVHTQMGSYIRQLADEPQALPPVYVSERIERNAVFAYLTHRLPVQTFADAASEPPPPGALFVLSGYGYAAQAADLAAHLGQQPVPWHVGPDLPGGNHPAFVVYRVPEMPPE